jgi:nucleotide-binding universal stress UspA family protein
MRLLLAVDLNDRADELLAIGRQWAERLSARLDVAYVDQHSYDVYLVQDPSVRTLIDREWTQIRESERHRLGALVASLPEQVRGEAVILLGRAAEQIVEAGATRDAILIATHGRRGLAHMMLGSVSERVVRLSRVPVITFHLPGAP